MKNMIRLIILFVLLAAIATFLLFLYLENKKKIEARKQEPSYLDWTVVPHSLPDGSTQFYLHKDGCDKLPFGQPLTANASEDEYRCAMMDAQVRADGLNKLLVQ